MQIQVYKLACLQGVVQQNSIALKVDRKIPIHPRVYTETKQDSNILLLQE